MAYTDYFSTVQEFYIGFYQRPADPSGLIYWASYLSAMDKTQDGVGPS